LNIRGTSSQGGPAMLAGQASNSTTSTAFGISPVSIAHDGLVFTFTSSSVSSNHHDCDRTYYVVLQAGQISFRAALDTGMKRASFKSFIHNRSQVLPISGLFQLNAPPVHVPLCQDTPLPMLAQHLCPSTIMTPVSTLATLMGLV
jgi:hypothetical protein